MTFPEHGDRKDGSALCKPPVCVSKLSTVLVYAESRWKVVSLFAVSMAAYFGLLTCRDRKIERALFLSPVTDMERLTRDIIELLRK